MDVWNREDFTQFGTDGLSDFVTDSNDDEIFCEIKIFHNQNCLSVGAVSTESLEIS